MHGTRRYPAHSAVLWVTTGLCILWTLRGKAETPLPVEDIMGMASISDVAISPDGSRVAYLICRSPQQNPAKNYLHETDGVWYLDRCRLAISSSLAAVPYFPTEPGAHAVAPAWSPDGRKIAFISDQDGGPHLWVAEVDTREVRRASDVKVRPTAYRRERLLSWLPDGQHILIKPNDGDSEQGEDAAKRAASPDIRVLRWPDKPAEANGATGFTPSAHGSRYRGALGLIDLSSGALVRLPSAEAAMWPQISPDGRFALYQDLLGVKGIDFLYAATLVSTRDGRALATVRHVVTNTYPGPATSWSPSGRMATFADCRFMSRDGTEIDLRGKLPVQSCGQVWDRASDTLFRLIVDDDKHGANVWRIDPHRRAARLVGHVRGQRAQLVMPRTLDRACSGPDNDGVLAIARDPASRATVVLRLDRSGKSIETARLHKDIGVIPEFGRDVSIDCSVMAFVGQDAQHPPDVWLLKIGESAPVQVSKVNPQLDRYQFGEGRLIQWRGGLDGRALSGALFLPPDYTSERRYPLVTMVYGTHALSEGLNQFHPAASLPNVHFFTTRGYAVLLPDSYADPPSPASSIVSSIIPGVDKVVDLGIADSDRLAVIGHSYGGYTVLSLLVNTTRFRAAVAVAGPYDLLRQYGTLDESGNAHGAGSGLQLAEAGLADATPWKIRERYIENSPIFYLDRVTTPLLLIHGALDPVPVAQADAVFLGLRQLDKPVEYVRYARGAHGFIGTEYEQDYYERIVGWFDLHLKEIDGTTKATTMSVVRAHRSAGRRNEAK